MTEARSSVADTAAAEAPTASHERFEQFTASEAEHFLASRFRIFSARGLDTTQALLRATRVDES